MKALWIAKRELTEQRLAFAAAALAGLLVPLVEWIRNLRVHEDASVYVVAALVVAFSFAWVMAAFFGAGMLGRDLEHGKFGFYLSRPLSLGALFGGKLLAGVVLSLGTALIVLLPTALLVAPKGLRWAAGIPAALALLMVGALFLLISFHAISVAVRSRSTWILLDLASLTGFAITGRLCFMRLIEHGAFETSLWLLAGLGTTLFASLALAGWLQMARGRTDLRRGHRILSITLAAGLALSSIGAYAYSHWVLHPGISSLATIRTLQLAQRGDWIFISGRSRWRGGYQASFLWNLSTGKRLRVEADSVIFSEDGKRVLLEVPDASKQSRTQELWIADLEAPVIRPRPTGLDGSEWCGLSQDGKRIALSHKDRLTVHDLETGRRIAAFTGLSESANWNSCFLDPDHFRAYESRGSRHGELTIKEFDLTSAKQTVTGSIAGRPGPRRYWRLRDWEPVKDRILVWEGEYSTLDLRLCEGRSGKVITTLADVGQGGCKASAAFLQDGRIVLARMADGRASLTLLDAKGQELWNKDLGVFSLPKGMEPPSIQVLGESSPGHLLLCVPQDPKGSLPRNRLLEMDLASGSTQDLPALQPVPHGRLPLQKPTEPGSLRTRLFLGADRSLVLREPNGAQRIVLHATEADPQGIFWIF